MRETESEAFEVWYAKLCKSAPHAKKACRAGWNAAWHLMKKQANDHAHHLRSRAEHENQRYRALLEKAGDEIDRLEAGLPTVGCARKG